MENKAITAAVSGFKIQVQGLSDIFIDKLSKASPTIVGGMIDMSALNRASDIVDWMEKEKYVNLVDMRIECPSGMSSYYHDYLSDLEHVWMTVRNIETDLLIPVSKMLAAMAAKPEELKYPTAAKLFNITAPMLNINPDDMTKKLARNFGKTTDRTIKLGNSYRNARDIEDIAVRVKGLNELVDGVTRKNITRLIATIAASSDELIETHEMHPMVQKKLCETLLRAAKWVELFGAFNYQILEVRMSVVNNCKKFQQMAKK